MSIESILKAGENLSMVFSIEERLASEAALLAYLELNQELMIQEKRGRITHEKFSRERIKENLILRVCNEELDSLIKDYLRFFNFREALLLQARAYLREINQIKSSIELSLGDSSKYYIIENYQASIDQVCTIRDGYLLLPIENSQRVNIKKIIIGAESTGSPADTNINNLFDAKPDTYFHYVHINNNKLKLNLEFDLKKVDVINELKLKNNGGHLKIEDIVFLDGSTQTSIKKIAPHLKEQDYVFDGDLSIDHLPVKANRIIISLSSEDKEIKLAEVAFKQNTFKPSGYYVSDNHSLKKNLYAGIHKTKFSPLRFGLAQIELASDKASITVENENFVLNGNEQALKFKLILERNIESIKHSTSFIEEKNKEIETLLRSGSANNSPSKFRITNAWNNLIYACQPGLGRLGSRSEDAIYLRTIQSSLANVVPLPIDLNALNIDFDDFRLFVDGVEWVQVDTEAELAVGTYLIQDDGRNILFAEDISVGAQISYLLREEEVSFEEKDDGFYYKIKLPFDPEKSKIRLFGLPESAVQESFILPKNKVTIRLGKGNITALTIDDTEAVTFSEVASKALLTATGEYYLDRVNGVIYLYEAITDEDVRVTFTQDHYLEKKNFNVVLNSKAEPEGIQVSKEEIAVKNVSHTIGQGNQVITNLLNGGLIIRADNFSTNSKIETLAYKNLIKGSVVLSKECIGSDSHPTEVNFIDGYTEFEGLIYVQDEKTIETRPTDNIVTFRLAMGSNWYSNLGLKFSSNSIFVTEKESLGAVTSQGDWFVNRKTGIVSLYTTVNLPSGIALLYYYKDSHAETHNLYSIDYEAGILYSSEDLVTDEVLTYKVAQYKIGYDIARKLESSFIEEICSVKTEALSGINSLVRLCWFKEPEGASLIEMQDFFSPIYISTVLELS